MDEKLKKRWVKALRSGEYEQGRGQLRTWDGRFCCLGVLCNLIDNTAWDPISHKWKDRELSLTDTGKAPLYDMLDELDMSREAHEYLINMNDDQEASFKEIADWIEENL